MRVLNIRKMILIEEMWLLFIGVLCVAGSVVQCDDLPKPGGSDWVVKGGHTLVTEPGKLNELRERLVAELADLSTIHGSHPTFKEVAIEEATVQVVAGTITRAVLSAIENDVKTKCWVELYEKPWVNHKKLNVSCGEEEPKRTYQLEVGEENPDELPVLGGVRDVLPENLEAAILILTESIALVNGEHKENITVVKVNKVQSQVVSGKRLLFDVLLASSEWSDNCMVKVWDGPWVGHRETNVKCKDKNYSATKGKPAERKRRQAPVTSYGGVSEVPQEDWQALTLLLTKSINQVNEEHKTTYRVAKINNMKSQVVSGYKYDIDVLLASTEPEREEQCTVKIWDGIGHNSTEVKCNDKTYHVSKGEAPTRKRRQVAGGVNPVEPDQIEEVTARLRESLVEVNEKHGTQYELIAVKEARAQSAGGRKLFYVVKLKNADWSGDCDAELYLRPWENFKETNLKCQDKTYCFESKVVEPVK